MDAKGDRVDPFIVVILSKEEAFDEVRVLSDGANACYQIQVIQITLYWLLRVRTAEIENWVGTEYV